jgi:type IX secretion system PorP/SprF family membrane protein
LQTTKKLLLTFQMIILTNLLMGQDIHFSQYFNSPLNVNPAQTGNFEGDWRAIVNYRDQWNALKLPYRTTMASFDQQLSLFNQHLGVGGYLVNDRSGSPVLKTNKIFISGAYYKTISNHNFSAGLQLGYVLKKIDPYTLPEDYNNIDGTFNLKTNPDDFLGYFDVNFGVNWKHKINRFDLEAGLALFHLNHPKESFFGDRSSRTPIRSVLDVSAKTDLATNLYVKPGIMMYSLRGSRDFMLGSQAGVSVPGNRFNVRDIHGGVFFRTTNPSDALIALLGVQVQKFLINFSYDINVSSLNQYTNGRGAFEVSIIYTSISTIIKTFTIPCERI